MASNLRGNLGLKSSPLAPTACKLSSQYLVLDHMTNHYNKIAKAKPAIDNKPPSSLASSQKIRDRKNRHRMMTGTPTYNTGTKIEDAFDDFDPEDDEERLVQSIMRSTLGKTNDASHEATYGSGSKQNSESIDQNGQMTKPSYAIPRNMTRPMSARSSRSMHSIASGSVTSLGFGNTTKTHDVVKATYNGDLLEKRSHVFTEPERPFTPRTLKTKHESRLKNSKSYSAPRSKSVRHSMSEMEKEDENQKPKPQPRRRPQHGGTNDFGETLPTNQMTESMLMDITIQSRDEQRWEKSPGGVPPLAISMDPDHMSWIQEQASKAEVRARSSNKIRSSIPTTGEAERKRSVGDPYSDGQDLSSSIRLETLKK